MLKIKNHSHTINFIKILFRKLIHNKMKIALFLYFTTFVNQQFIIRATNIYHLIYYFRNFVFVITQSHKQVYISALTIM